MSASKYYIGTSGWSYDHWKDIVYPIDSPDRDRLDWYVKRFDTVEVNSSYYHWPRETTFDSWRERVPSGFTMTIKAPRGLTHSGRLANAESWVERIQGSMDRLGDCRGVFLAQLPPSMGADIPALENFLTLFTPWQKTAVELRNFSWHNEEVFNLLAQYNAAYCVMSGAGLPCVLRATAGFVYVRLHGPDQHHMYGGSYSDNDLNWWADRIREWNTQGLDVYVYFNNDYHGNAVRNAETLRSLLG